VKREERGDTVYRCDPAHEPPRVGFDFKLPIG